MKKRMVLFVSGMFMVLLAVSNLACVSGQSVLAQIVPPPYSVIKGESFVITVTVDDVDWMQEYQFTVSWETEYFEYVGGAVTPPASWTIVGPTVIYPAPNRTGVMFAAAGLSALYIGGKWNVAAVTLKALKTGSTWIVIDDVSIQPSPPAGILTQNGLVVIVDPSPPPPERDLAVIGVSTSTSVAGFGETVYVDATIENQGSFSEAFEVTVYANTIVIQTKNATLAAGDSATLHFAWSTATFGPGNYTISAYVLPVADESETADNTFVDGVVYVIVIGDVNGDGKVTMIDLYLICVRYGTKFGEPAYDPACDVNSDGNINMLDLWLGALNFGLL